MVDDHFGTRNSPDHQAGLVFPFGAKLSWMSESASNFGDFSVPIIPNHRPQKSSIIAASFYRSRMGVLSWMPLIIFFVTSSFNIIL